MNIEKLTMLEDGNDIILSITNPSEEGKQLLINLVTEYTKNCLSIKKVTDVKPLTQNIAIPEIKGKPIIKTEKNIPDKTVLNENSIKTEKDEHLIPEGKYAGMTVNDAINKSKGEAISEIIDFANMHPSSVIVTDFIENIKASFGTMDSQKYASQLTRSQSLFFFNSYGKTLKHDVEKLLVTYSSPNIETFCKEVDEETLHGVIYTMIDKMKAKFCK